MSSLHDVADDRATTEQLDDQASLIRSMASVSGALEHLPTNVAVVNRHRQIVYANRAFAEMMRVSDPSAIVGSRLGEAANCRHSHETGSGCGTTRFCTTCGALRAQITALAGRAAVEECRIISRNLGEDLNLRIWARPVEIQGEPFAILTLHDIGDEKRRELLEHIFFHDILNTASGIQGLALLLGQATEAERDELAAALARVSSVLIDEIKAQRDLMAVERGEFTLQPRTVSSEQILAAVIETYARHELAGPREIRLAAGSARIQLITDPTLLRRVLGNMTKNALEACPRGGAVTLGCAGRDDRVIFSVHNPSEMPRAVQLQVFQRSFSTKGPGRGLGTYSMKLISERYLQGTVSFDTAPGTGTVFYADYPRALALAPEYEGLAAVR